MGRRRRELIDQSQKKPNICKNKQKVELQWWRSDVPNHDENKNSAFIQGGLFEAMKRMNPQQLYKLLLKNRSALRT